MNMPMPRHGHATRSLNRSLRHWPDLSGLSVDPEKLSECREAWIHVRGRLPADMLLAFAEDAEPAATLAGVLRWSNSD